MAKDERDVLFQVLEALGHLAAQESRDQRAAEVFDSQNRSNPAQSPLDER